MVNGECWFDGSGSNNDDSDNVTDKKNCPAVYVDGRATLWQGNLR
jgi:hypothetical protein